MAPPSVPADPGWDEDLAWLDRDPMTAAEREAWLDRLCAMDDDPCDGPQEYWDPQSCAPPPGQDELTEQELAGHGPVDPNPGANTMDCYQRGISRPRYPAHQ